MARLFERLNGYTRMRDPMAVKFGQEVKDVIRLLEDLLGAIPPGASNQPGGTTIVNNFAGANTAHYSMPIVIDPSMQLFPDGMPVQFTTAVKIKRAFMDCDRGTPATAPTTFTFQNQFSGPTSTGTVTFATGATFAQSTTLGVVIGLGQKLYVKAPAALNDVQRINNIHIEYESQ
jgi:hypothetical protein